MEVWYKCTSVGIDKQSENSIRQLFNQIGNIYRIVFCLKNEVFTTCIHWSWLSGLPTLILWKEKIRFVVLVFEIDKLKNYLTDFDIFFSYTATYSLSAPISIYKIRKLQIYIKKLHIKLLFGLQRENLILKQSKNLLHTIPLKP